MTPEQQTAFLITQTTCAFIEALGMQAENMQRNAEGNSMAYTAEDFQRVIDKYGIHHNAVLTFIGNHHA